MIGHYQNSHRKHKIIAGAINTDANLIKTIDVSESTSEYCDVSMASVKPIFAQDSEQRKLISKKSPIFMNAEIVR